VSAASTARPGDDPRGTPGARPRRRRPTIVTALLGVGLVAIAIAAVVVLSQRAQRRSGTNLTADYGYVIPLQAGEQLCEPGELLPGDTAGLRLDASSGGRPGPLLVASVVDPHARTVATGMLRAGWQTGQVTIPLTRVARTLAGATVCLVDRGTQPVAFGGSVPDANFYVALGGKPLSGRMRIEYMRPGRESWFALIPTLGYRLSLAKADFVRHWAVFAAILAMLVAIAVALRTVVREESAP
jgi:hypothetical protein